ncbi:DNA-protecting protein DprA [Candidatus Saccharibacteria bacterium]|nr:DNA-protecting protein DprA [Candidatus Saccharibacteria bacterium]
MKINQIRPQEGKFTEGLSSIALKPKILYYAGKIPEKRVITVAIVGARKNTAYGEEIAYRAAYECAKAGMIVVSGLAYGIDSIAHRGALDAGGITLAVLGTPIDQIYPRKHQGLAEEIIRGGGAIISEYGPGDKECVLNGGQNQDRRANSGGGRGEVGKLRFLARNRLISGLSDAVLIAEAAEHSGSLNTASHALEQGRDLYAAPADITRVTSAGCNQLIKKGAEPYLRPADLIEPYAVRLARGENIWGDVSETGAKKRRQSGIFGGSPLEKQIVKQIASGVRDGDEIIARLAVPAAEFNQAITMLEIRDIVKSLGMNSWMLK